MAHDPWSPQPGSNTRKGTNTLGDDPAGTKGHTPGNMLEHPQQGSASYVAGAGTMGVGCSGARVKTR